MKRGHHAVAWVALVVAAFVLWPQRWGGSMTYVVTSGTSMQPRFAQGDLAILRSNGNYRPGDVAAYRSTELKRIVMHRITRETAQGYTFKGDNNDFLDPETVSEQQMLGKLAVRVPKVGLAFAWLLKPINLILAVGALFLLFSDRKDKATAPGAASVAAAVPPPSGKPLVVRITALRLPQELPTADVVDGADLERLAQLYGLAILRDGTTDYLLQGGMVFQHLRAVEGAARLPSGRRATSAGRDWVYASPVDNVVDLNSRRDAG